LTLFSVTLSFSQEENKELPFLFQPCDNSTEFFSKNFIIPLASDFEKTMFLIDAIESGFSVDQYQVYVIDFKRDRTFVRDIWLELSNQKEIALIPFCALEKLFKQDFKKEFANLFEYIE
jgi:hypothetical protein